MDTKENTPRKRKPKGRVGVEAATRERRYGNAERRIRLIVDAWPPLTPEQREKLALLLCPGGTGRRDAGDAA